MPSGVYSINYIYYIHKSWGSFLFNLRDVSASFMRSIASVFFQSAYLWQSFLSLTHGTLRSWCRVNAEMERRSYALKIYYLRRSEGISRRQSIGNDVIRERASAQQVILERIEEAWNALLTYWERSRFTHKLFKWTLPEKKKWREGQRS